MPRDRKKPGVAFWTAVALVAVLAYPLSFGPAIWLGRHCEYPSAIRDAVIWTYWPITILHADGPKPIHDALDWYFSLWYKMP